MTRIRDVRAGDADALDRVERASMHAFAEAGIDLPDEGGATGGDVVVVAEADGVPVGYAAATVHGDRWHLEQVSVHPDRGRRGIGTALVAEVVERARAAGAAGLTLTTFRDLAFNGRWYAGLGFVEVDEHAHPWLAAARASERAHSIDVAPRCAMELDLR